MDINRLKHLSGIDSTTKETKISESSKVYSDIKFVHEAGFRGLSAHFGAKSCIVEDIGSYIVGTVLFEATDDSSSVDKLNKFDAAWNAYIASSSLAEAYKINSEYHSDEYPPISGLEGPFKYADGQVLYYSPKINKYYNSKTDVYLEPNEVIHNDPAKNQMRETSDMPTSDNLNEVGNTNFFQPVDDKENTMQDRTGQHKDSLVVRRAPADVIKSVIQRKRELQHSIEQYDDKGFNEDSQKEKAIECLDKIMDNLSGDDPDGFKQAQIYFTTLMSPITDLFPSNLVLFLTAGPMVREQNELDKHKNYGDDARAAVLKRHIEHYKRAMRFYNKDSYAYKDLSKAIERSQKELDFLSYKRDNE